LQIGKSRFAGTDLPIQFGGFCEEVGIRFFVNLFSRKKQL